MTAANGMETNQPTTEAPVTNTKVDDSQGIVPRGLATFFAQTPSADSFVIANPTVSGLCLTHRAAFESGC